MFRHVDFANIFVAGGSVLAALQPDLDEAKEGAYFNTDIDVFVYGLDLEGAKRKCVEIYEAVRKATTGDENYAAEDENQELNHRSDFRGRKYKGLGFLVFTSGALQGLMQTSPKKDSDILCIRNLRSLILVGQYPRRHIQIIFRLYKSPTEILIGFDIDSCCFGYDGTHVYTLPRGLRALTRRYNLIDMTRRSASYEYRLFKYSKRHFGVLVPSLPPSQIHHRHKKTKGTGLARLLSLEAHALMPDHFRRKKRSERDRGEVVQADREAEWKEYSSGKVDSEGEDDDYSHYQSVRVPYGKKWGLKRVANFVANYVKWAGECFGEETLQSSRVILPPMLSTLDPDTLQASITHPMILSMNRINAVLSAYLTQYRPDGKIRILSFDECWIMENPGDQLMTGSFEPLLMGWDEWVRDACDEGREVLEDRNGEEEEEEEEEEQEEVESVGYDRYGEDEEDEDEDEEEEDFDGQPVPKRRRLE
ncbi:hypothetical protein HDU97_008677 [Phlyctochytrium planicorne]|nr:hypothetical protein HDU97_008677 [Phlyctochytrium planicorne]